MIAHSEQHQDLLQVNEDGDIKPIIAATNEFSAMINFAERIHRNCTTAIEDRSMTSPYFDQTLIHLSREWAEALVKLENPKKSK